jgi:hypothetical protein
MRKRLMAMVMVLVCLLGIWGVCDRQELYAQKSQTQEQFSAEVTILREDEDVNILQVQVGNTGEDFDGTVRLLFGSTDGEGGGAFDTKLTLPSQGQKQYTLSVPSECITQTRGIGTLFFLDENQKTLGTVTIKNLLGNKSSGLSVGVLSDHYDKLSYLDMAGETFYLMGTDMPISLQELDANNLESSLDGVYFLVIDQYDVTTLDASVINSIQEWVKQGGWLILGTGDYITQVTGAFDPDFLEISYGTNGTGNTGLWTDYDAFVDSDIDISQIEVVELGIDFNSYPDADGYDSSSVPGSCVRQGKGAMTILGFSLGEDELQNADTTLAYRIYDETMSNSTSYYDYASYNYDDYNRQSAFGIIDHANTSVNFNWLELLIGCYVILVGPVLYFLLSVKKKKEWYWLAVPATGVIFIAVVFLFGKDLRVKNTKVYSVSVQCADGKENNRVETIYSAYHSGVKPWSISLNDNYSYGESSNINYGNIGTKYTSEDYHYLIGYGDGLQLGLKPASNFENGYFYAQGTGAACGQIITKDLVLTQTGLSGSITNATDYDFPYMLLRSCDDVLILSDVKAGETVDLAQAATNGKVEFEYATYYFDEIYDILFNGYYSGVDTEKYQLEAALYLGASQMRSQYEEDSKKILVEGVVEDYTKTVSGKCNEVSFGCLYQIAEQKVTEQEVTGATN